ncbi:MAG: riboflavin synthase [Candidatus Nanopelagicales bacterium]|nr:riboflavin synthase [Candidatus Nanopelagicales bacterium]
MFTGIVEELGRIAHIESFPDAAKLKIQGAVVVSDVKAGDSIAVNGVCLTVVDLGTDYFTADVMAETLNRSSLGKVAIGSKVNLERAARLDSRIGGHLVQGHVDGVGSVIAIDPAQHWTLIRFTLPTPLANYLVEKGSITVDGVSLTVVEVGPDYFSVSLIPTTLEHTTLGALSVGDIVNLEVDVIAKYVERLMKGETK